MKKIICFSIIFIFIISVIFSCNIKGSSPVITNIIITDVFGNPTNIASIGDTLYVYIYASDEDMDMTLLNGKYYLEGIFQYQLDLELPEVSVVNTGFLIYYSIAGPVGSWKVDIQITDAKGNGSNVYTKYFTVIS